MHKQPRRIRFIALLLGAAALLLAGWASADPPTRVLRLGYTYGSVSFSPAGEDEWLQASVNRPLVAGDRLWADAGARAELQVGRVMVRMGSGTSVTVLNLDDNVAQLQLAQGTLNLRVRGFEAGNVLEIDTPNLAFSIRRVGDYRIDVDPAGNATTVLTRSGQAEVLGESAGYVVDAGKSYRFYGTGLTDYEYVDVSRPDDFDRWAYDRDRRWEASVSARYVSPEVVGYQDLDAYGTWRVEPGYGPVWAPTRVAVGWAPYRDGHWAWIDPWGWTWVDDAPWGFAVSHYGRWASVHDTWCWVPGPVAARAVYAPALVAFVGGRNFEVAVATGSVGAVGWFPLGPRDVYQPAYPVSRAYFNNVNVTNTTINVTNITNVYNHPEATNVTYANRHVAGAVVAVPTTAFVQAQPVSRAALPLRRESIATAPVTPVAAVAPMPVSVRGQAAPGHKPPVQVLERPVIAKTAPAPAPVPFATKEKLLSENPGKPLDRSAVAALKPATPAPAPKVQLIGPARTASPAQVPPLTRGQPQPGGTPGQRGEPAPVVTPPGPSAAPPMQRKEAPTAARPPVAAPAPMPAEPRGKPEQREQPPRAVAPPPAAVPMPAPTSPEPRGQPEQRTPAPLATPPASTAQPAPVPAPVEQRGKAAPRVQPPAVSAPPQPQAPAPAPVEPRGTAAPRGQPPTVSAPPQPQAPPSAPLERRARPEQKPQPPAGVTPSPAPAPAPAPAPVARPAAPAAPPMTSAPGAPPRGARTIEQHPAAGAPPQSPPAAESRGPGGKPPGGKEENKKGDERSKADDEDKKQK